MNGDKFEATAMMKADEIKLAEIKAYVESCRRKFTNPYLKEDELDWVISKAEQSQVIHAWEETARNYADENIRLKYKIDELIKELEGIR